ncbi:MAG TPA: hypothetical protein VFL04_00525, partial [Rectinemataceae bacterium]|nr:hypothetical protein [Rectinemataceae bacterium]
PAGSLGGPTVGLGAAAADAPGAGLGARPGYGAGPVPAYRKMLPFSDNPPEADRMAALAGAAAILGGALTTQAVLFWWSLGPELRYERYALETLVSAFGLLPPALTLGFFGLLPLAAGAAGLILPLGRELGRLRENARRRALNARILAGRRVLEAAGELELACLDTRRSRAAARRSLDSLAAEFGASVSVPEPPSDAASGLPGLREPGCRLSYSFPRLAELLAELERLRGPTPPAGEEGGGGIVFDSGD